jgi:hypothetical protein
MIAAPVSNFDGFADDSVPREPVDQVGSKLADRAECLVPSPDYTADGRFWCCRPKVIPSTPRVAAQGLGGHDGDRADVGGLGGQHVAPASNVPRMDGARAHGEQAEGQDV